MVVLRSAVKHRPFNCIVCIRNYECYKTEEDEKGAVIQKTIHYSKLIIVIYLDNMGKCCIFAENKNVGTFVTSNVDYSL